MLPHYLEKLKCSNLLNFIVFNRKTHYFLTECNFVMCPPIFFFEFLMQDFYLPIDYNSSMSLIFTYLIFIMLHAV